MLQGAWKDALLGCWLGLSSFLPPKKKKTPRVGFSFLPVFSPFLRLAWSEPLFVVVFLCLQFRSPAPPFVSFAALLILYPPPHTKQPQTTANSFPWSYEHRCTFSSVDSWTHTCCCWQSIPFETPSYLFVVDFSWRRPVFFTESITMESDEQLVQEFFKTRKDLHGQDLAKAWRLILVLLV